MRGWHAMFTRVAEYTAHTHIAAYSRADDSSSILDFHHTAQDACARSAENAVDAHGIDTPPGSVYTAQDSSPIDPAQDVRSSVDYAPHKRQRQSARVRLSFSFALAIPAADFIAAEAKAHGRRPRRRPGIAYKAARGAGGRPAGRHAVAAVVRAARSGRAAAGVRGAVHGAGAAHEHARAGDAAELPRARSSCCRASALCHDAAPPDTPGPAASASTVPKRGRARAGAAALAERAADGEQRQVRCAEAGELFVALGGRRGGAAGEGAREGEAAGNACAWARGRKMMLTLGISVYSDHRRSLSLCMCR